MTAKSETDSEESKESGTKDVSEEDVRRESSKIAKQATEAHDKATELMNAAAAAGDPEERQKFMEEALEQQIQSGSLGKTAKYLRSGTFQGMAVGAGLGIAPGASLGTITGALVGGVSSTALGGLGAGLGAATGALHGPFWDMKKGAGKGIQKITGNLPGWTATERQKRQLEKIVGQISEQDAPRKDELEDWGCENIVTDQKQTLTKAQSKLPSVPSMKGSKSSSEQAESPEKDEEMENHHSGDSKPGDNAADKQDRKGSERDQQDSHETQRLRDRENLPNDALVVQGKQNKTPSTYTDVAVQTEGEGRKKPRKLQTRSSNGKTPSPSKEPRNPPRKLEKRSQ